MYCAEDFNFKRRSLSVDPNSFYQGESYPEGATASMKRNRGCLLTYDDVFIEVDFTPPQKYDNDVRIKKPRPLTIAH